MCRNYTGRELACWTEDQARELIGVRGSVFVANHVCQSVINKIWLVPGQAVTITWANGQETGWVVEDGDGIGFTIFCDRAWYG